jgi:predicted RNA-binding Zn-ribbon protein involved in translation (DUF1610 family)
MTKRSTTTVIFCCPKCGITYRAIQDRFPDERPGRFDCVDCNAEVHAWTGFYDFTCWKAMTIRRVR